MAYVVTRPYVTLKVKDENTGAEVVREFYEGGVLPDGCVQDDVDRLLRKEMIAEEGSDEARLAAPAGTPKPGEPPNVPVTEVPAGSLPLAERQVRQLEAQRQAEGQSARPEGQPAPYASKGAWVDYAVSRRADGVSEEEARAEAEGKSKADLIHDHGGQPAAGETEG
jgi:hypothetical protein